MGRKKSDTEYQSVDDPDIRANGDAKPVESKADRFRRLANKRVPAAIKRLTHVANLSNRAQYEYTDEQAAKIVAAFEEAVKSLRQRYSGQRTVADSWSL